MLHLFHYSIHVTQSVNLFLSSISRPSLRHNNRSRRVLDKALLNGKQCTQEIRANKGDETVTNYTRWVEAVQIREENVYLRFSPRFKRVWLKTQKHLLDYVAQDPANIGLRK